MQHEAVPGHHHSHDHHPHGRGRWARVRHALVPHSHDHVQTIQSAEEASAVGIRAAWISLAGMALTASLQIVIVWISGSVALLADTLHNLGHLVTTIPLIIAFRIGRRPATRRYSHGFQRAEDLVGLLIGAAIAASAALIVWESVQALSSRRDMQNLGWVLAAAIVGAAGNELVARYRISAGRRIGSAALIAEGQHARADALTSLAVIGGVAGAWFGWSWLDPVIGLGIAVVIVAVLVTSMRVVVRRLMDGAEPETLAMVEHTAAAVPGVVQVRDARVRWSGHRLLAEFGVVLDGELSLAQADLVIRQVEGQLTSQVPHLERATITPIPDQAG